MGLGSRLRLRLRLRVRVRVRVRVGVRVRVRVDLRRKEHGYAGVRQGPAESDPPALAERRCAEL